MPNNLNENNVDFVGTTGIITSSGGGMTQDRMGIATREFWKISAGDSCSRIRVRPRDSDLGLNLTEAEYLTVGDFKFRGSDGNFLDVAVDGSEMTIAYAHC